MSDARKVVPDHSDEKDLEDPIGLEAPQKGTGLSPVMCHQQHVDIEEGAAVGGGGGLTADSEESPRLLYRDLQHSWSLADLLLDERVDIKLVRGTCLKALYRDKRSFIRRQELESHPSYQNAFVTKGELTTWKASSAYRSKVRIIGVSHVWETREHPDPRGQQLAMLAGSQFWHDKYSWYFLDYMSVYQFYRTSAHQNRSFQYTMMHMHFFYAHEHTWTYRIEDVVPFEDVDREMQVEVFFTSTTKGEDGKVEVRPLADLKENSTPYFRRGWCEAECQWPSMRSDSSRTSAVFRFVFRAAVFWVSMVFIMFDIGVKSVTFLRRLEVSPGTVSLSVELPDTWTRAPMAPAVFQAKVANRELLFTHQDSAEAVKELQARVFMEKAMECKELKLSVLPPRELVTLSSALPFYGKLQVLQISNSRIDVDGAEALSASLSMRVLDFSRIRICGDAVAKLAAGLRGNHTVEKVAFKYCLVDDEGAAGLADAMACETTKLRYLDLSHNVIECTGAKHLAHAFIQNRFLRTLDLGSNFLADHGAAEFACLFEIPGLVLETLLLDYNSFGGKALAILRTARNSALKRHGKVRLNISCRPHDLTDLAAFPPDLVIDGLLFFDIAAAAVFHVVCVTIVFGRLFLTPEPAGFVEILDIWVTMPGLALCAFFALAATSLLVDAIQELRGFERPDLFSRLTDNCCCMSRCKARYLIVCWIGWIVLLPLYNLGRPQSMNPTDSGFGGVPDVVNSTLVLTALLLVQAVVVWAHPTYRVLAWNAIRGA